jgi:hypothetical protein
MVSNVPESPHASALGGPVLNSFEFCDTVSEMGHDWIGCKLGDYGVVSVSQPLGHDGCGDLRKPDFQGSQFC